MTRFIVRAICTIAGSNLENQTSNLWYGKSRSSAATAMARLQEKYAEYYRDWRIDEVRS